MLARQRLFNSSNKQRNPWYLAGAVSRANCVAAYQPIGALNLAASYANLAHPGLHTAFLGVAPTWDITNGWKFNTAQYLKTDIVPASGWSAIIRFSNVSPDPSDYMIFGEFTAGNNNFGIAPVRSLSGGSVYYYNGNVSPVAPKLTSGVLAIAGSDGYRNGVDNANIGAWGGTTTNPIYIGGYNNGGSPVPLIGVYIQAIAIYNTILTPSQISSITTAMQLLPIFFLNNEQIVIPNAGVAETWYANTAGSSTNNGTINQPWDLATAFSGGKLGPGDTLYIRGGTYTDPASPSASGTEASPITIKAYPGEHVIFDGNFSHSLDWCIFEDIEFMYSGWTSRESAEAGSAPSDIPIKDANLRGNNNQYIGCIFHDLRGGVLWYTVGGEMHDCISFFHGWQGTDRKHGHCYYIHNGAIQKRMVNCMGFDSFGYGVSQYSASESLDNVSFKQCAMFSAGRLPLGSGDNYNFHVGGESGISCDSPSIDNCITYDGDNVRVGYNSGATNVTLTNNIFPEGILKQNVTINTESGNDYGESSYVDYVKVWLSEKKSHRANIIIANHVAKLSNIQVDVSSVLSPSDNYRLRNVRNYWNDAVTGTVPASGIITIDMQQASHSIGVPVALGVLLNAFPDFGAFIIEKI